MMSKDYEGHAYQKAQIRDPAYRGETLEMASDHVARIVLRASGVYPTQPWYKGQISPDTKNDVNRNVNTVSIADLQRNRRLQTSTWIAKAVACITTKLHDSMSAGN